MESESQSNENEMIVEEDAQESELNSESKSDSENEEENQSNRKNKRVRKQPKTKRSYEHLRRERRPKGEKNHLQAKVNGFWTKNFLQAAKKPHLDCIKKFFPVMVEKNEDLKEIDEKDGISMQDFVTFYSIPELDEMWKEFFANKVLFRELMISRSRP